MSPVGLELTITAGERPQMYALHRAATGTCNYVSQSPKIYTLIMLLQLIRETQNTSGRITSLPAEFETARTSYNRMSQLPPFASPHCTQCHTSNVWGWL